jgi:hypothetical protein
MLDDSEKTSREIKILNHNFLQILMSYACKIDKNNLVVKIISFYTLSFILAIYVTTFDVSCCQ